MRKIPDVAITAVALFGLTLLGGCQLSQSGASTYGVAGPSATLKSKPIALWAGSPQPKSVTEDSAINVPQAKFTKRKKTDKRVKSRNIAARKSARLPHKHRNRAVRSARFTNTYDPIIRRYAKANGVPYRLARAVVQVESGFRPNARGKVGEIGLMQLRKNTARGMGYRGSTRGLYKPETNIRLGMQYLGKAYRLGGKSTCGAILKYNAGHGAKKMNPVSRRYCRKVKKIMGS